MLYQKWRTLDISTRIKLADILGLVKKGSTHVNNNVLESDGYLVDDVLHALSVAHLQQVLETEESDEQNLFNMLFDKAFPLPEAPHTVILDPGTPMEETMKFDGETGSGTTIPKNVEESAVIENTNAETKETNTI